MSGQTALVRARAWLERHGSGALVVPHGDPDGLAAGAILATRARGGALHVPTPWEGALPADRPLVVADWGVRPVPHAACVLFVDHHADPEPVEGVVVHGDDTDDPTTSLVAWRLLDRPAELAWLAALGAAGDLGAGALGRAGVPAATPVTALRRLAVLTSAAGRLRDGPVAEAFAVLSGSPGPAEALADPRAQALDAARREVEAHRRAALRAAPRVGPSAALIELDVPARVHSQVASAWARRLAPRVVVVANAGWRAGRVSFAVRSASEADLRAWLRRVYTPPAGSGDYGRGHARATGGSLVPEAYADFAAAVLRADAPATQNA